MQKGKDTYTFFNEIYAEKYNRLDESGIRIQCGVDQGCVNGRYVSISLLAFVKKKDISPLSFVNT